MILTNAIKLLRRNLLGANALANLSDVNLAIDQALPFDIIQLKLTASFGVPPTVTVINPSGTSGIAENCSYMHGQVNCFTITSSAPGQYILTMTVPAPNGFNVLFGPAYDAAYNIGAEVISSTQVAISTYEISANEYTDAILKDTYVQILINK